MKKLVVATMSLLSLVVMPGFAAEDECAACKLVTDAEMQAVMGELKGKAKCDTGVRPNEVTCNYDNMAGSWVKIRVYKQTADQWSFAKNMLPNKTTPIPGLGDEALSTKEGSDAVVYIHKGEKTLEVGSSGGLQFAKPVAEKAFARMK